MSRQVFPKPASGRFVLRISPRLHGALRRSASEAGVSLNNYCVRKLSAPGSLADVEGAADVVLRAAELFGEELIAIILYGSWARGEAHKESDADLLIVVGEIVPLVREHYRRWDEKPVRVAQLPVEPHFVHLPDAGRGISSLWAEAALEGIVLFERGLRASKELVRIRGEIVCGRIRRKMVHGQPCWMEEA